MKRSLIRRLSLLLCLALCLGIHSTALAEGYVQIIPPQYDGAGAFVEGMAAIKVDEKWGFIDKAGQVVVPPKYDDVLNFQEGFAAVMVGDWETGKWGFIDLTGKEVVPPKYEEICSFHEGMAAFKQSDWRTGKWGFIDQSGVEVISPKYDDTGSDNAYAFRGGLAKVWISDGEDKSARAAGKWGYINKTGQEIVPVIYDKVGMYSEGLICVVRDGMMGFVDETGAIVVPLEYCYERPVNNIYEAYEGDVLPFFSEGLAAIWGSHEHGDQYGYIDREGNVIIPFEYDFAGPFSEGLAYVTRGASIWYEYDKENIDGKFGYINKIGQVVVPLTYDCDYVGHGALYDWRFVDGYAQVSISGDSRWDVKYGLIDKTGKIVVPIRYNWLERMAGGLSYAGYGEDYSGHGTWDSIGLINEMGEEIVAVDHYAWIGDFIEGYAWVRYGGDAGAWMASEDSRYGFIDMAGNEVVPCIFDFVGNFSEGLAVVLIDGKCGYISIEE